MPTVEFYAASRNKLDGQRTRIDLQSVTLSEIKVRHRIRSMTQL